MSVTQKDVDTIAETFGKTEGTPQRQLQVGDKVRIVRRGDFPQVSDAYWDAEMDPYIGNGKIYKVRNPDYDGAGVELVTSSGRKGAVFAWVWPAESLELVA